MLLARHLRAESRRTSLLRGMKLEVLRGIGRMDWGGKKVEQ